jgi:hypothetical protein
MTKFKHRANNLYSPKYFKALEIDVRAESGRLVLKHNWNDSSISFDKFLRHCKDNELAINVKDSGLVEPLNDLLKFYSKNLKDYFMFDMSIPDLIDYIKVCPKHTAFRLSEFENEIFPECNWIWLDNFHMFEEKDFEKYYYLTKNYKVVVVSPELHNVKVKLDSNIVNNFYGICTDIG